jgi:hypothetical protein
LRSVHHLTGAEVQWSPKGSGALGILKSTRRNSWQNSLTNHKFLFYVHTEYEFCAELDLGTTLHLSYSRDLAPFDYLLFGYIKDELQGLSFPSAPRLHRAIDEMVQSID